MTATCVLQDSDCRDVITYQQNTTSLIEQRHLVVAAGTNVISVTEMLLKAWQVEIEI